LLGVRKKLGVQCSSKLSTADLEAEIFLYLVDEYSRYLHICQIKKKLPISVSTKQNVLGTYGKVLNLDAHKNSTMLAFSSYYYICLLNVNLLASPLL